VQRIKVESSSINSMGYEADTETLEVCFCSGAVYEYAGVSQFTYDSFMASESKGHFFAVFVRPCFEARRLHDVNCRKTAECWCRRQRRDVTNVNAVEVEAGTKVRKDSASKKGHL
jgi:KTSC domain-containing protein